MNSQEALILFIGAVLLAAAVVFTLSSQVQSAVSSAQTVSGAAARSVVTEIRILSVYGNASDTNVVVKGISGTVDVNDMRILVDGRPYVPVAGYFVTDRGNDGFLDPGDLYVATIPVAVDPDKNCIRVLVDGAEDIYGRCI